MPKAPRFSLIVLNWNKCDLLRACLASIEQQDYSDYEVIVVDNGSEDDSCEMVERDYASFRLIRVGENTGFCRGNNIGIAEAGGEVIVLVNNDSELRTDFLSRLSAGCNADPAAGMYATKVLMYDRPQIIDSAGLLVYPDGVCRSRGWLESDGGEYDEPAEILGPAGCAAAYRRTMLDDVGLLDDRYFAYLEDLDLAFRGQLRGWRCRYVPDAVSHHKKSMTSGYHSAFKAHMVERNRLWNVLKLFPLRLLALSPLYTLVRYAAQGYAAVAGFGISSSFARDYSRARLVGILLRSYLEAFKELPGVLAERRHIQSRRKLSMLEVYSMMKRYRLPVRDLAFKD